MYITEIWYVQMLVLKHKGKSQLPRNTDAAYIHYDRVNDEYVSESVSNKLAALREQNLDYYITNAAKERSLESKEAQPRCLNWQNNAFKEWQHTMQLCTV